MKGVAMAYGTEDGIRYQYYEDLKQLTLDLGYSTIKEAIITEYEKLGGATAVGAKLGKCGSRISIYLHKFKYPHIKGKGGPNNPLGLKFVRERYANDQSKKYKI